MELIGKRQGFATNSSSTHSIIFCPPDTSNLNINNRYGFDPFICASREAKINYFVATVVSNIYSYSDNKDSNEDILYYISEIYRLVREKVPFSLFEGFPANSYVDHQSCFSIPRDVATNRLSIEFFYELYSEILDNDECAIIGGNDNEESTYDYGVLSTDLQLRYSEFIDRGNFLIRKEEFGYILFFQDNGTKLYYGKSGKVPLADIQLPKKYVPELVDMTITDYCSKGCKFCYRGCTAEGKHASLYKVITYIDELKKAGVFEIALGGGEPLQHPELLKILEHGYDKGITMNLTTRDYESLKSPIVREVLQKYCGAIGISVSNVNEMKKIREILDTLYFKVTYHYVLGLEPVEKLYDIVQEAIKDPPSVASILLLGFKPTGRASDLDEIVYEEDFINITMNILKKKYIKLGVDTAVINRYPTYFTNVDPKLYYKHEGIISKYIDAVAGTMGESSFVSPERMVKIPPYNNAKFIELLSSRL